MKILRPEVKILGRGGIADIVDDVVKTLYNITDDEYDLICEEATDEEMDAFVIFSPNQITFAQKRRGVEVRNKYIDYYKR